MAKTKTHVIVPGGMTACGIVNCYRNAMVREGVTCPKCKKTDAYKLMPTLMQHRHKYGLRNQGSKA